MVVLEPSTKGARFAPLRSGSLRLRIWSFKPLAERPMHGYEANLELERRQVRDWAGISRPQVYYSLEKLAGMGFLRAAKSDEPGGGAGGSVLMTTVRGRTALADALEREGWTTARERPPFLTWIALSWQARPGVFEKQMQRRRNSWRRNWSGRRPRCGQSARKLGTVSTRRSGWSA